MSDLDRLLDELVQAGEKPPQELLDRVKAYGPEAVRPLIAMATDERFNEAHSESPEVWAPEHAIRLLGELAAAEAVEPLLPLFGRLDDEWLARVLPEAMGKIGRPALAPMRALLLDQTTDIYTRSRAGNSLAKIGRYHPELRADVIAALVARLDPAETQTPDDEALNGFVVGDLLGLEAVEAAPAIIRAFEEDRVDPRIAGGLRDVEQELGLEPSPSAALRRGRRGSEPGGLRLYLRCTACGYEREHFVGKVYYDLPTRERRERGEQPPYSEFIITRRITCPKCGARDRYELSGDALIALTAEVLKRVAAGTMRGEAGLEESPLVFTRFAVEGYREMHPLEAREWYHQRVEAEPSRADLRVRYGNVLYFLGYTEDATRQFRTALELDPANAEAYTRLGSLAWEAGELDEARRMFTRVPELAPGSPLLREQRDILVGIARQGLAALGGGAGGQPLRGPQPAPVRPVAGVAVPPRPAVRAAHKIGRNDPCPCGSGKKYKKCCGQ